MQLFFRMCTGRRTETTEDRDIKKKKQRNRDNTTITKIATMGTEDRDNRQTDRDRQLTKRAIGRHAPKQASNAKETEQKKQKAVPD